MTGIAENRLHPTGHAAPFGLAFPGQGNKPAAVVESLRSQQRHPVVAEFLAHAGVDDPAALDLCDTAVAQPATYVAGVAAVEAVFGPRPRLPLVLGHSLGELTAAACAGLVDVADGLRLAIRRGEVCHEQHRRRPGAMVAVMGARGHTVELLRRTALGRAGGMLEIAGLNGRRQVVLSGDLGTVQAALPAAAELGLLAEILPIGGSFHSPLMYEAVPAWREAVEAVPFRDTATTFVSSIDAAPHTRAEEVRELLVSALLLPVRWLDTLHAVRRLGVDRLWDAGPGQTVAKLGRREGIVQFGLLAERPVAELEPAP